MQRFCNTPRRNEQVTIVFAANAPKPQQQKQQQKQSTRRVNLVVREIMELIQSRYGQDEDWNRTKMYLYRSKTLTPAQAKKVLNFLDSQLNLPPSVITNLLQKCPRILNKPVQTHLKPTAEFLLELYGRDLFEQAMIRNPKLLLSTGLGYSDKPSTSSSSSSTAESVKDQQEGDQSVETILLELAGFSASNLKLLKRKSPFVFGLLPSKVKSILEYLTNLLLPPTPTSTNVENNDDHDDNFTKTNADNKNDTLKVQSILRKMILANPSFLNLGVETNLKPRVEYLSKTLDLSDKELAKIIQTGSVLGLSVENNLKPKVLYLQDKLQLETTAKLKKCILSHPQLLALSLENLKIKVDYFEEMGPTLAPRIALRCPAVFSLSMENNIIPTIDFLTRVWGNETNEMDLWLTEYPNILTLSVEGNLQPTMNFYNRTGYTLLGDDWELQKGSKRIRGRYIAASLFNRLLPRWHFCVQKEVTEPLPLHVLVSANDADFCEHDEMLDLDEFLKFKKESIPRLKFSSQFDTWLKTGRPIDI